MDSQVTELLVEFTTRLTEWNEEVDDPERFFAVVHANADAEAAELQSAFDREGFGRAGEVLITCVDETGQSDLLGKVAGESLDELVPEFKQLDEAARSAGDASEEVAGSSGEAELWQQAVDQFGPQWVNWDGTEETWAQYRDWFYQVTNAVNPDLYAVAYQHLDPLNADDPATRIAKLKEFGFDVSGIQATAPEAAAAPPDEAELWQQAVDQFGPQWVNWDGTEETWGQYRDWFYQVTNTVNPDLYAIAYQHLDPLNADDPATRIAKLKEFGFDVSGTESATGLLDEEKVAELHQEVSTIVEEALPDGAAQYVTRERIDALVSEFPEAANLDPDQLRAVIKDAWELANA
ncbi:hypothetical protein [Labedaea rhizosphaerae]|uniref:Uncharacterized protein n=1 Tax=Labedaea rhizosphaerae TaxID=598644 RepID=A0A4R6RVI1_LABRH|nr:hypothetical protein [Labedaea rhizosphaerae]TDP91009.1 hypothetical protein EV186_1091 [Labedaea rhizosphaerae]